MANNYSDQRFAAGFATNPTPQRKVAIPRLQKVNQANGAAKHRRRVPRACTGCRSHKIKCTGERPSCKHCATTSRECVYIMPRKDRLKIVTERCHEMASILRGLRSGASGQEDARIAEILEAVEEDVSELRETVIPANSENSHGSPTSPGFSLADPREEEDELDAESMDLLDENLHEDEQARATGFIGKASEVQWLRIIAAALVDRSNETSIGSSSAQRPIMGQGSEQVSSFSYWTDGESLDLEAYVDPYELPQSDIAERLLQCYMLKVHDSFPILPRKLFEHQFRVYFRALQSGNAPRLSAKWQTILNLVFAIGAKYSHLIKAPWRADGRDHLVYHARARAFGLNETTIMNHADVPQIQSLGLLAFYWLTVGQVNRAWSIIGMALRSAYALGLHVRNEDPAATATKRETLVRTWWSLHSLERILTIVTGRPSIILDSSCSVPLPLPVAEEHISDEVDAIYRARKASTTSIGGNFASPTLSKPLSQFDLPSSFGPHEANAGSYFTAVVRLSIITQNILTSLYSAGTMIRSSGDNQQVISQLVDRLDLWVSSLPIAFRFDNLQHRAEDTFARERTLLLFQFCSAKVLLTRPCLTSRRQSRTNDNSFTRRMANMCVGTTKIAIASLPDNPDLDLLYNQGPWWCIVHHLMQFATVLLLALSFPSCTSYPATELIFHVKKVLHWLRAMQDPVAERASVIAMNLLHDLARQHGVDVSDTWRTHGRSITSAPQPDAQGMIPDVVMNPYLPEQYAHLAASSPQSEGQPPASYAYGDLSVDHEERTYPSQIPVFEPGFYMSGQ